MWKHDPSAFFWGGGLFCAASGPGTWALLPLSVPIFPATSRDRVTVATPTVNPLSPFNTEATELGNHLPKAYSEVALDKAPEIRLRSLSSASAAVMDPPKPQSRTQMLLHCCPLQGQCAFLPHRAAHILLPSTCLFFLSELSLNTLGLSPPWVGTWPAVLAAGSPQLDWCRCPGNAC